MLLLCLVRLFLTRFHPSARFVFFDPKNEDICFLDLCQWDSEVSIKSLNFKDTRQKNQNTLPLGHVKEKKSS